MSNPIASTTTLQTPPERDRSGFLLGAMGALFIALVVSVVILI